MNKENNKQTAEELNNSIDPEEIVFDDDSEMPEPETKTYEQVLKCTNKFMRLFNDVVGSLPYASVLKNASGDQIKLIDLVKYIEKHRDSVPVSEMNRIVAFIANIEFKYARPLMEQIEDTALQKTLWELVQ